MSRRDLLRNGLWLLFTLALLATIGHGLLDRRSRPEELPLLGIVPIFELTERSGAQASLDDLLGRPFVVDFVFTRCKLACPTLTTRMAKIGGDLREGEEFRRVSISVDPEHDTPAALAAFATKFGAPTTWWFLTGEPDAIHGLVSDGFRLALEPATGDPANPIGHSNRFVLVDGLGRIRGYYDGLDLAQVRQLDRDLVRLVRAGGR
jgi:protein SCO1/2